MRGYIAMLATREDYRGRGIASKLVRMAVDKMIEEDADEVRRLSSLARWLLRSSLLTTYRSRSKQKSTTSHHFAYTKT